MDDSIRRVGIVFSGGPAPAANAVISAATLSFLDADVEVLGFLDGWEHLSNFTPDRPLLEDVGYRVLHRDDVSHIRGEGSIILRTSRLDPAPHISAPLDLADPDRNRLLRNILSALENLEVDALITIGGDGTLGTSYYLSELSKHWNGKPIRMIHIPKSIDCDYFGIDFTFGFMTAADYLSKEVRNIRSDAQSSSAWYILELMGRQAGWLTYAAGIAGSATQMYSVEDFDGVFDIEATAREIVELMLLRAEQGRRYGVICIAEGLAELLPKSQTPERDHRGVISLGTSQVCRVLADAIEAEYLRVTGEKMKIRSKQLGYEARCAPPNAFDVLLGSQLGTGAARALLEENLNAVMVSVEGQFNLRYVPFIDLINPATLKTRVRFIERGSDFYRLARSMEDRKRRHRGE
jgi:6-phosphofructokinase 1